ncbi:T9SS type A sorting domain-containing protein [Hymenobacter algoricola]
MHSTATARLGHLTSTAAGLTPAARQTMLSRPGRAVYYTWDESTSAWVDPTVLTYAYDGRGALTEEVAADSATLVNQTRLQYTYDAQGRNTGELNQVWDGSTWQNQSRFLATYDAQGNTTEELQQNWRSGAWFTAFGSRYANTYLGSVLSSRTETRWDNGTFENWSREVYTISNGEWTTITAQEWALGAWQDYERLTDIVWQDWASRRLATLTDQTWVGTWQDLSYITATHAPNGSSVYTIQVPTRNGTRLNDSRQSELYDAQGSFLLYQEETWRNAAWEVTDAYRELPTYAGADRVTRRITQSYDNQLAAFVNQERFNYAGFVIITGAASPVLAADRLQLYPNPTTGRVTVLLPGTTALTGAVLNTLGQQVQQFTLAPGGQLDVTTLPAGVYTVRLQTPQGQITRRLIRQ